MGKKKKIRYELKKTKYMVNTRKEREKRENFKSGTVQKIKTYQYLGITINKEGNLEEHTEVIARNSKVDE